MTRFVTALLPVLISACASFPTDEYRERLLAELPRPDDVEVLSEERYPGGVMCGEFSYFEGNGFVRATRRYIVTPDFARIRPGQDELALYCSDNPLEAAYERLGFGPGANGWETQQRVSRDLRRLQGALETHYNEHYGLPRTLAELAAAYPDIDAAALRDPWGRPYRYEGGLGGRVVPNPKLGTLGADGRPGGAGADADINLRNLPFLEHLLRIEGF
jgi:hypothetical protein